jgi:chemotaxis protein histidine kinase CheA
VLVPSGLCDALASALAHVLRNAVAHGIEAPAQRRELGKPEVGSIELSCRDAPHGVVVQVGDDGAGFDLEALGRRAGPRGDDASGLDLAFIPGVSTRELADDLAGHGVGLGAARETLRNLGYLVTLNSEKGRGATIVIEPVPPPLVAPLG